MKNVTVHLKPWIIICRGHIWYKKFAGKKKIRNRNYNSKSGIFLNCEDATFINHIHCFVRCLPYTKENYTFFQDEVDFDIKSKYEELSNW